MSKPVLYILSGLPGTGKSTLGQLLAAELPAAYLRIDTIEQVLAVSYQLEIEGQGYHVAYKLASDNLSLGISIIADSCNPIALTRREWEAVAHAAKANFINIEIICSDKDEHQRRVENRQRDHSGLTFPSWEQVTAREYDAWQEHRVIIDTAGQTVKESFAQLLKHISD